MCLNTCSILENKKMNVPQYMLDTWEKKKVTEYDYESHSICMCVSVVSICMCVSVVSYHTSPPFEIWHEVSHHTCPSFDIYITHHHTSPHITTHHHHWYPTTHDYHLIYTSRIPPHITTHHHRLYPTTHDYHLIYSPHIPPHMLIYPTTHITTHHTPTCCNITTRHTPTCCRFRQRHVGVVMCVVGYTLCVVCGDVCGGTYCAWCGHVFPFVYVVCMCVSVVCVRERRIFNRSHHTRYHTPRTKRKEQVAASCRVLQCLFASVMNLE